MYHAPMGSVSERVAREQQSCILTHVTSPSAYALHSESMYVHILNTRVAKTVKSMTLP